jgi:molybdopterin/thiamine biosynthesis adenylyltransferase
MARLEAFHVRLSRAALLRALRELFRSGAVCAESPLTAYDREGRWDWFAHEWIPRAEWPRGAGKHSLGDWVVLALASDAVPDSLALLRELAPGPLQRVAALVLQRGESAGLTVTIWDRGELRSPEVLEVVGAEGGQWWSDPSAAGEAGGAVQATAAGQEELLAGPVPGSRGADRIDPAPADRKRRSRTWPALPGEGARLAGLHVAVAGLGRMGLLLAQSLAGLVGRLTLIDADRVGWENLDAMPLASEQDVGRLKVEVATRALLANRSELAVYAVPEEFRGSAVRRLLRERRFDLLVTCVDERGNGARLLAARWSREQLIPHLDVGSLIERDAGGARQLTGDVRLFEPEGPGCAACCPPLGDEALRRAQRELASPVGSLPPGPHLAWWQTRLGSLFHWNAVVCGVAVETWLRFRAGELAGSVWTRLRWPAGGLSPECHTTLLTTATGCRECRG